MAVTLQLFNFQNTTNLVTTFCKNYPLKSRLGFGRYPGTQKCVYDAQRVFVLLEYYCQVLYMCLIDINLIQKIRGVSEPGH